jgi:SAM-dependent methyltransferase
MLALARAEAPGATLVLGSLWDAPLPTCVGVAAVGEAFSYAVDPAAGLAALGRRLEDVRRALVPGGVLLLDVAGPGRAGPEGARRRFWTLGEVSLGLEEREEGGELIRELTTFEPDGPAFRRVRETHRLHLYLPEDVEAALTRAGFDWERLPGYGARPLPAGWHAWVASRR